MDFVVNGSYKTSVMFILNIWLALLQHFELPFLSPCCCWQSHLPFISPLEIKWCDEAHLRSPTQIPPLWPQTHHPPLFIASHCFPFPRSVFFFGSFFPVASRWLHISAPGASRAARLFHRRTERLCSNRYVYPWAFSHFIMLSHNHQRVVLGFYAIDQQTVVRSCKVENSESGDKFSFYLSTCTNL